ncbi:MAG: hypothetical protein ACKVJU_01685 [Verrucomicrobiales bacterium]
MKRTTYSMLSVAICFLAMGVFSVNARTFTNNKGETIEAELVSSTGTHAVLKLTKGGKDYSIPLSTLSKEDQDYIAKERTSRMEAIRKELSEKTEANSAKDTTEKIVAFVKTNKSKQVGNGKCWTLANEAFKASEAKRPVGKGLLVWGARR